MSSLLKDELLWNVNFYKLVSNIDTYYLGFILGKFFTLRKDIEEFSYHEEYVQELFSKGNKKYSMRMY